MDMIRKIEKCSSPTGDGNKNLLQRLQKKNWLRNVVPRQGTETLCHPSTITACGIEKCSSPTGDGNDLMIVYCFFAIIIEKCSSPTGDGNSMSMWRSTVAFDTLRNVVPRQGTETFRKVFTIVMYFVIEKCSSPTGDGNSKARKLY